VANPRIDPAGFRDVLSSGFRRAVEDCPGPGPVRYQGEMMATGTVEQRPASSLVLFDRDGKVIWKAP